MNSILIFVRGRKVLVVILALFSALTADSLRPPSEQITARIYVAAVQAYQRVGRPLVSHWVHCRYQPTCSVYSIQAVRTHGIAKGLLLTGGRLIRCFPNVPYGTFDPVPPAASELMPTVLEPTAAALSVLSLVGFSIVLATLRSRVN
ncbi:MAG: membrane protein insertion efficiency factor YidD [Verrucomicrobiia bacterium]|jgi:putative membrane protein insertion efficiency factor